MKKTLANLLGKLKGASAGANATEAKPPAQLFEVVSGEELLSIRGGDKEYKPIYEDAAENPNWQKPSMMLDM